MTVSEILSQYEGFPPVLPRRRHHGDRREPLLQMEFVTEFFEEARRRDIHTCLDTSGVTFRDADTEYLEQLDGCSPLPALVMLDLKTD